MTITIIETRSEFGFPQLASFFKEPEQKPKQSGNHYRIQDSDGEEDYYDQLGAVI